MLRDEKYRIYQIVSNNSGKCEIVHIRTNQTSHRYLSDISDEEQQVARFDLIKRLKIKIPTVFES